MNIPGFTAGISVYKTKLHYRLGVSASGVSPLSSQHFQAANAFVTPAGCDPVEVGSCPLGGPSYLKGCCDAEGFQGCCGGCWTTPVDSSCGECCPPGARCCEGTCLFPGDEDPCGPGWKCCAGTCAVNNPSSQCCTNVTEDPEHCGDCGHKCNQWQQCANGKCCYPLGIIAVIALFLCIPTFGAGCQTIYEQLQKELPVCPA